MSFLALRVVDEIVIVEFYSPLLTEIFQYEPSKFRNAFRIYSRKFCNPLDKVNSEIVYSRLV